MGGANVTLFYEPRAIKKRQRRVMVHKTRPKNLNLNMCFLASPEEIKMTK